MGIAVFLFSFSHGALLARLFSDDKDVIAAAADYLRSYAVDCVIVGINFSMMGYLNGNGKTFFVALQGILSTRGAQNRQRNVWQPLCKKSSETSPFLWGRLFALFLCIFPRCCAIVITK
ncbi:MAG: MATE family efflux transporter [Fusicatenibacter saccharivorans]